MSDAGHDLSSPAGLAAYRMLLLAHPASGLDPAALDALAIILTEVQDLLAEGAPADPNKVATIRHAAYTLDRVAGKTYAVALVTHRNGVLIDRYAAAREALR